MAVIDGTTARRRLVEARVARLATVDAEGRPHVVPIVFAVDGDDVYSAIDDKPKVTRQLKRLRNIARHPHASLIADHYDEDWRQLWWVRADGEAEVLQTGAERERALELLRAKYIQYDQLAYELGAVVALRVSRWRGWSYA